MEKDQSYETVAISDHICNLNAWDADNVVPPSTDVEWMEEADISSLASMLAGAS